MKNLITLLLSVLSTLTAFSQSLGEVKLRLIDSTDGATMVAANVALINNEKKSIYKITDEMGMCNFQFIPYGQYELRATFIGYDTLQQSVHINQPSVDLGAIKMKFTSQNIKGVSVMAHAIRTSQNGDTVIYNADAYKVTKDALVEGLLAKMPGIKVDDGEVEAQGETVKRVYLDGKEFFGEDVALAVKNIPADIIAKVEVFNKLSDNAEFTGFDDGDSYKALNFVTRKGMNKGHFGKFTAGYALDDLYQVNANYNYFVGDHRLTVVAMANNMNIKSFGSMDLVGGGGMKVGGAMNGGMRSNGRSMGSGGGSFVGAPSGISTLGGLGLNYAGSFAENKLKMEASYFYNLSNNEVEKETDRQYITDNELLQRYYDANSNAETDNHNHRINMRLEYKPNERHSLMMRPEFAFQDNGINNYAFAKNTQSDDGEQFSELNTTESQSNNDKVAYTISNNVIYRALIGQTGRNIMMMARGSYSDNQSDAFSSTYITYPNEEDSDTRLNSINGTHNYNIGANLMYSEPILDKKAMLTAKYSVNHRYSDADYLVYEWEQNNNIFNPEYDPTRSNIYNSGYTTHNVGPGFMYSVPKSMQLNANVSYQYSTLSNEQQIPVISPAHRQFEFDNIIYAINMHKSFNSTNSLRMMLRSHTENPSVSELQDVVKDSDPQNVTSGNSNLQPSYNHTFRATYNRSNIYKGTTFMAMLSANLTDNYIGESKIMLLDPDDSYTLPNGNELAKFGQFTKPVNLDGNWRVTVAVSYGTPVYFLYSNINLDLGASYGESPSLFNGLRNVSMNSNYKAGISLGSNISEFVDFTLAYNGGYNTTDYKYAIEGSKSQRNEYFTHKATAQFKFILWKGITLSGNAIYSRYKGITDDFQEDYILCNLYIGKKIFKNQRGEISLGVNDLFNQSESFVRNITDSYIENVKTNTLGRYFGIKLSYDLRSFVGSKN